MNRPRVSRLPRTVTVIGSVSLFNDFASEMVVPLIPLLLASVLAAGPVALGVIEGVADTVSNLLKLWAGRRSDLYGRKRKPYVVFGYTLSNIVRPLIGLSGSWLSVLFLRVTDRVGKGVRTAPRDAMVADAIEANQAGRAYGLLRALDHAGAVLGALAAAAVVHWGTRRLDLIITLSAVPGLLAVGLIAFGVTEQARIAVTAQEIPSLRWSALSRPARNYLSVVGMFMLGRIPETFLLLRGHELGVSVVELLLLWAALHVVKSSISEYAGRRADIQGRRPLILIGWSTYVVALTGLAFAETAPMLWAWGLVLGLYFGLSEGAERALVRDLASPSERGTAFGWFHTLVGLAAIPAGLFLGLLWSAYGVRTAFLASAAITAIAVVRFWRYVRS